MTNQKTQLLNKVKPPYFKNNYTIYELKLKYLVLASHEIHLILVVALCYTEVDLALNEQVFRFQILLAPQQWKLENATQLQKNLKILSIKHRANYEVNTMPNKMSTKLSKLSTTSSTFKLKSEHWNALHLCLIISNYYYILLKFGWGKLKYWGKSYYIPL